MAEQNYHYCGYAEVVPASSAGSKRMVNESNEVHSSSRTMYKDNYSGCSNHYSTQHKAEEFVDKHSGRLGFKEEVKFTSTQKVVDKVRDYTTEYKTQVQFKKTVYPNKTTPKSNNNRINYY